MGGWEGEAFLQRESHVQRSGDEESHASLTLFSGWSMGCKGEWKEWREHTSHIVAACVLRARPIAKS